MERVVTVYVPRWVTAVYALMAVVLIPWIFDLAQNLPARHIARNWDIVWIGFDVIMLCMLLLTAYFMARRLIWVVITASALATMFLIDAWFDILTSKSGQEMRQAVVFGVIEVTLALMTYRLVFHMIHHSTPDKRVHLVHHKHEQHTRG